MRHDLLMARAVRGLELEAVQRFREEVSDLLTEQVGGRLVGFDPRGNDVTPESNLQLASIIREAEEIVARGTASVQRLTDQRLQTIASQEAKFVTQNAKRTVRGSGYGSESFRPSRRTPSATADVPISETSSSEVARSPDTPWLGDKTEKWFKKLLEAPTADGVRQRITQGIQRGDTVDDIVRSIRGTETQEGILDASERAVQALVRTSSTSASAQARMLAFEELGVTHWLFLATLDTRTTLQCAANDGQRFPLGEGPIPPLHVNCRSVVVPDLGSIDGTRASIDGQVDANINYEKWLGTRTVAEQNEVLGVAKGQAWRDGMVTLKDLLGRDLEPLTLAELRALDRLL